MYQRLRRASLWEGEPLDESSGLPLTHDILAALNLLEPTEEDFIEQPWLSQMLKEPENDVEDFCRSQRRSRRANAAGVRRSSSPSAHNDSQISKHSLVANYSQPTSAC
jgi:hypothetical protein